MALIGISTAHLNIGIPIRLLHLTVSVYKNIFGLELSSIDPIRFVHIVFLKALNKGRDPLKKAFKKGRNPLKKVLKRIGIVKTGL